MKVRWSRLIIGLGAWVTGAALAGIVHAEEFGPAVCGELENAYGPYDYRTEQHRLKIVDKHHFTAEVESLRGGITSHRIGGDISYTLRASPNHHRALHAMARLAIKEKRPKPKGSPHTVDCWFERGMRFSPTDAMVPLTYGIYLSQTGKKDEALKMLKRAESLGERGANFHYNIGLVYVDLRMYDDAVKHAKEAYRMGFNLPGLREKLQRAGKWGGSGAQEDAAAH